VKATKLKSDKKPEEEKEPARESAGDLEGSAGLDFEAEWPRPTPSGGVFCLPTLPHCDFTFQKRGITFQTGRTSNSSDGPSVAGNGVKRAKLWHRPTALRRPAIPLLAIIKRACGPFADYQPPVHRSPIHRSSIHRSSIRPIKDPQSPCPLPLRRRQSLTRRLHVWRCGSGVPEARTRRRYIQRQGPTATFIADLRELSNSK